jgi:hypothetical protein
MKRESESPLSQVFAERLVSQGAVLTIAGLPLRPHLIGALRWAGPNRVLWFVAHGDSECDGHALQFDEVEVIPGAGMAFLRDGAVLAYLTSIAGAPVEDPDDYRIGWQIWKDVTPLHEAVMTRAFTRLTEIVVPAAAAPMHYDDDLPPAVPAEVQHA